MAVKPVKVAAGLVFKDEKLLITKRLKNIHLGGMWEFPGGKLELGESYEICLKREMFEELGVKVNVSYEFEEVLHRYSEMTVLIKFFICSLSSGTPKAIQCSEFQWINRRDLTRYNFPAADIKMIDQLRLNNDIWNK